MTEPQLRIADRRRWRQLARDVLACIAAPNVEDLSDEQREKRLRRILTLLLEQEYARGYIQGHDDGFDEGVSK